MASVSVGVVLLIFTRRWDERKLIYFLAITSGEKCRLGLLMEVSFHGALAVTEARRPESPEIKVQPPASHLHEKRKRHRTLAFCCF